MTRAALAVSSLLVGAGLWGIAWWPFRILREQGLAGAWVALAIYFVAFAVSLPLAHRHFHAFTRRPGIMLGLLVAGGWTNVAFVLAILDGNIMRVLLLFYLSPLWAVILARLFLKEKLSRITVLTLIAALIGAGMMLWQEQRGTLWPRDYIDWLAISSGFAFAVSNLFVRMGQGVSIQAKALATWTGVIVVAVLFIALQQLPAPVISGKTMLLVALFGVFGIIAMTICVLYGVTRLPLQRSAVILLFELVVGAISQVILTDEKMTVLAWIGGVIIVTAGYFAIRYSRAVAT